MVRGFARRRRRSGGGAPVPGARARPAAPLLHHALLVRPAGGRPHRGAGRGRQQDCGVWGVRWARGQGGGAVLRQPPGARAARVGHACTHGPAGCQEACAKGLCTLMPPPPPPLFCRARQASELVQLPEYQSGEVDRALAAIYLRMDDLLVMEDHREELKALRGSESEGEDREGCVGVPQGCCAACQLSRACSHALQRPNGHQWQPAAREPAGGAGHAVWRRRLPDQACALRCVEGSQLRLVRARVPRGSATHTLGWCL